MVALKPAIRAAALSLAMAAVVFALLSFARTAHAGEFAKDFPKSYSDFVKMKPMAVMHMMDTDKKGFVTKEQFMKFHEDMFDKMDKNKDGKLSREEWLGQIHSAP